eukprot:scaffold6378_cov176-Amphora_coffeaeformis.AAC.14
MCRFGWCDKPWWSTAEVDRTRQMGRNCSPKRAGPPPNADCWSLSREGPESETIFSVDPAKGRLPV